MKANLLKIGDIVWMYDINHREYARDANGRSVGSPIFRGHWVRMAIVGETSRSWIIGPAEIADSLKRRVASGDLLCTAKIPKTGDAPIGWAFSDSELEDIVWANDNKREIIFKLEQSKDVSILKQVAALLGV